MRLSEVLPALCEMFPAADHKLRDIPGGGQWYYIPWQKIRERLNEVCPGEWAQTWGEPTYLDGYCYVKCSLTICGCSQEAIGSAPISLTSKSGKDMSRGNPIERAIADAFKNAAEAFGICAYLDDQADDSKKKAFVAYMRSKGDGKANALYLENNGQDKPKPASRQPSKPFGGGQPTRRPEPRTEEPVALSPLTMNAGQPTAIDEFKGALQDARSIQDCEQAWNRLQSRRGEWGDLHGAGEHVERIYRRYSEQFQIPVESNILEELSASIGEEVKRLELDPRSASAMLEDRYGKTKRSQLTADEALDFLEYLKQLNPVTA